MTTDLQGLPSQPGRAAPRFANWTLRSLSLGSTLALLETSFVYATGFAPFFDVLLIWVCQLALCMAWGGGLAAMVALAGRVLRLEFPAHGRLRDLGLLLFPALLFAVRGNVDPSQVNHPWATPARWGVTLAIVLVAAADAFAERQHLNEPMSFGRFALASWFSSLVVVGGFASRTLDFAATRDIVAADLGGRLGMTAAALCLAGVLLWRTSRRGSDESLPRVSAAVAGLFAISIGLALALRSQPPKLGGPAPAGDPPQPASPSVLLVVLDTFRADHLSVYGYPRRTTPNLDAFAEGAIVFETARAAATYSLSTHASLLTGALPSVHGAHPIPRGAARDEAQNPGHYRLRGSVGTLAEALQARGYITAGISGNDIFLARWTGLQRGFAQFVCEARRSYRFVPTVVPMILRFGPAAHRAFPFHAEWPAESITPSALGWLSRTGKRPFFLFLNYFDAHAPYHPRPPYDRRFPPAAPDKTSSSVSQYDGEIAYVDAWVGQLLRGLKERGRFDEALIVVTSDHGEFLGEQGLFGHPDLLNEAVLRIPLIVKLPGQRVGLRAAARVSQWQVREIVERVTGGELDPERLVASLDSQGPKVMAESWNPALDSGSVRLPASKPRARAVYIGPFKFLERVGADDWLFHLGDDPREENELSSKDPELFSALRFHARQAVGALEVTEDDPEHAEVDEAVLEKLRSLGYLGAAQARASPPPR